MMLGIVVGAGSVVGGGLAIAVFALVAWWSARVGRRMRGAVLVALALAVSLIVVEGIPVDYCAACRAGLMPEWWCWINLCW